ncbi:Glutathionyl-hydroquinone reductase YqjG [Linum grandiflorum]
MAALFFEIVNLGKKIYTMQIRFLHLSSRAFDFTTNPRLHRPLLIITLIPQISTHRLQSFRSSISAFSEEMARSAIDELSHSGAFMRSASTFRNFISRDSNSHFPPESGRYHLYVSYACPWASRCLAYLNIKGLDSHISFTSVKPIWGRTKDSDDHMGWIFPISDTEEAGADPDLLNGAKSVRDLYELASTNYAGKYTVPVCLQHLNLITIH